MSYAETDWPQLLFLYDRLMEVAPTPVVELNRAVVVAELRGAAPALDIVDAIAASGRLDRYQYLHATRADLLLRVGRPEDAAEAFRAALALTDNAVEQAFLIERIDRASSAGATPPAGMPLRWHS